MKPAKNVKEGNKRLLELADILDAADALHRKNKEPTYDQRDFLHECGTPACAMGHWVANKPRSYVLREGERRWEAFRRKDEQEVDLFAQGQADFHLDDDEVDELFDYDGCGNARTAKDAAKYIRKFVRERECSLIDEKAE